jgi:DNA-directed RNA polymerase subunit RPC12/RpoP
MTPHAFEQSHPSYQWGETRGGRPEDAMSWYRCTRCGAEFVHRYNVEPNIDAAARRCGIKWDQCDVIDNQLDTASEQE